MAFNFLEKAQAAGFDVGKSAPADNDLDGLKSDPRWKAMQQRWESEEDQKKREKHKKKYD
jgi:uncharacterized protein (DUF2237 family)